MAGYKASVLLVLLIGISTASLGMQINIDVDGVTSHGAYDINYFDEVSGFQEINATVENLGSIGCSYQLKAVFNRSNTTETEFSRLHDLWQGDTATMTVRYLPTNYTGTVDTELYVTYCDREEKLDEFNYTQNRSFVTNKTVDTRVIESSDRSASLRLDSVNKGVLIPEETPPAWKTSSTTISEGVAEIDYTAPIFDADRNMTYKVISEGELVGTTRFNLYEKDTIIDVLRDNIWKVLFILLLAINILLVATGKLKL